MATRASVGSADQRKALLVEVLRSGPDEAACQVCLSRLDDYIAAQLAGQNYTSRFREVAVHLDACHECAGAYHRLYELELAEATDRLPQPERWPAPDLSFLAPAAAPSLQAPSSATDLTTRLRAAIHRAGDRFTLHLAADLVPLLRPTTVLAPTRAPDDTERYAEIVLHLEPDATLHPDLPIILTAYRDARQPGLCLVEVLVEPPGRNWPALEGIAVALLAGDARRSVTTDAWGLAAFEGVPIADLDNMAIEVDV